MKKLLLLFGIILSLIFFSTPASAGKGDTYRDTKECYKVCSVCTSGAPSVCLEERPGIFGKVEPPPGVAAHGEDPQTGVINFLNTILRLLVVVGGLWALFNVIIAGYQFMSAGGDPKNIERAWGRIWQTLLGLVLVAGSFLLAAVIGQLLFGEPGAILSPKLLGPE